MEIDLFIALLVVMVTGILKEGQQY